MVVSKGGYGGLELKSEVMVLVSGWDSGLEWRLGLKLGVRTFDGGF